ncbi:MAG TPA: alpha/beta hydrolase family protein, partial [Tepidisphaeraceae bacterium]|nr:alpha/beta hydrolase family protein [Tepidisphaeraceae bacterium]
MSLCEIHWFSKTLRKQVSTMVILPDVGKPPFSTFYLLHGLSDDHTIWLRRTRIEHFVRDLPLIVVMPDGFRGYYTDNEHGPAYAKYINEELIAFIERNFPAKPSRSSRCIGGLSMGGYGALRAALGYPDRFVSANSHSGAVLHGSKKWKRGTNFDWTDIYGTDPRGTNHDLLKLAADAKRRGKKLPRLLIDCGLDDVLLNENREFHSKLDSLGVANDYIEFPGGHDWDYWEIHIREAIAFHAKHLKPAILVEQKEIRRREDSLLRHRIRVRFIFNRVKPQAAGSRDTGPACRDRF